MVPMTHRDAAFLWDTEALRGSPRRAEVADPPVTMLDNGPNWATLREAHYQTGIPIETMRKWARRGTVASFLDESEIGVRRMVRMDAVRARAKSLGRPIEPIARPPVTRATPDPSTPDPRQSAPAVPVPDPGPAADTKLSAGSTAVAADSPESPNDGAPLPSTAAPDGTMIVPIQAWDKMLMQLGNLHEAGQQLAEARERAAKAETEASFLRERLGELRRDAQVARQGATPPTTTPVPEPPPQQSAQPEPTPPAESAPARTEKLWRYIYRGWRGRRR